MIVLSWLALHTRLASGDTATHETVALCPVSVRLHWKAADPLLLLVMLLYRRQKRLAGWGLLAVCRTTNTCRPLAMAFISPQMAVGIFSSVKKAVKFPFVRVQE